MILVLADTLCHAVTLTFDPLPEVPIPQQP